MSSPTMPPMNKHDTETKTSLNFTVTRSEPELVPPAKPTPRELKPLSNLDDQEKLRSVIPIVQFYRYDPSMKGKDPAGVIRDALARALVTYYPIAGRLVEARGGRLCVDCTGEGVWFVEADADVELAQLGDPPLPPFSWADHFFPNVPASERIIDSPLYFFQVTRLKCGGFVFAFYANHIMSDADGYGQFLTAVGQIAQGAVAPSITPVWSRELFSNATHPPTRINRVQEEKVEKPAPVVPFNNLDLICRSFRFGLSELSTIRRLVPDHLRPHSTTFEILTACLWRCRTAALQLDPKDMTLLVVSVNARDRTNRVVPAGYYGNAVAVAFSGTPAKELCEGPIDYAIGLVKKAKEEGTKVCMSWRTNPPTVRYPSGSSPVPLENFFCVSDLRRLGLCDVDFGWGKPVYAGVAESGFRVPTYYTSFVDRDGDDVAVVSLSLEAKAMGRFETELNNLLSHD